jgi:hypothetical protein
VSLIAHALTVLGIESDEGCEGESERESHSESEIGSESGGDRQ